MSFLNRIVDKVYVINLNSDKEKLKSVSKELESQHILFERFEAIDGAKVKNDSRLSEFCNNYCAYGMKGCALSHMSIWKEALQKNYESIAVFEDDIIFNKEFNITLQLSYYDIPSDFDIIYLGSTFDCGDTSTYNKIREKLSSVRNQRINEHILKVSGCGGMYGYIISKKCMEKLVKEKISFHIDSEVVKHIKEYKLKTYAFQPVIVETDVNNSNLNSKYPPIINWILSHIKLTDQTNPIPLNWIINETAFQYKDIKLCSLMIFIPIICALIPLKYYYISFIWLIIEFLASFDFTNTLIYGIIISLIFFVKYI